MIFFRLLTILFLLTSTTTSQADPWFTGPLLVDPGEVVPMGEKDLELYGLSNRNFGLYEKGYNFVSTPRYSNESILAKFSCGIAKDVDFELDLNYIENQNSGRSASNLGDTVMFLGFQLLSQNNSYKRGSVRLIFKQSFPTGHYDRLDPKLYTTDATGNGSYLSSIELSLQYLLALPGEHYANLHGSVMLTNASEVRLHGLSTYGGDADTSGVIRPGNAISFDLAAEYNITQNWVGVMEAFVYAQQASVFHGIVAPNLVNFIRKDKHHITFNRITPSRHNIGNTQTIGSGNAASISLAPALEYNFSENIGIIGGTWFTIDGKNIPAFIATVLGINFVW